MIPSLAFSWPRNVVCGGGKENERPGAIGKGSLCVRWPLIQQREEDRRLFRRAICWDQTHPSSTTIGTRPCVAALFGEKRWRPPCSWESRWCLGVKRTAASSPCAIVVPTAAFHCLAAGSMAALSPASITDGSSSRSPANAWRYLH